MGLGLGLGLGLGRGRGRGLEEAMRMPSETGDCGTSTRFSLTWSEGSAVLNHWTEACCAACAVGFHTAPSWKPADLARRGRG